MDATVLALLQSCSFSSERAQARSEDVGPSMIRRRCSRLTAIIATHTLPLKDRPLRGRQRAHVDYVCFSSNFRARADGP